MISAVRHRRRRPVRFVAPLAAIAVLAAACSAMPAGVGLVASGPPAPMPASGSLETVSAQSFQGLIVGSRGRPVVVNVWASWCGPCRVEAPLLQRASQRYGTRVTFLGVNSQDSPEPARAFIREYGIRYPNVVDGDGGVGTLLSLRGLPTTYVFDRDGRVAAAVLGGISEQTLAARLRDVLDR